MKKRKTTMLKGILFTLGVSMLPVVELRGGIPFGLAYDLPFGVAVATAIIGNLLPIPFIIVFIRKIFKFLKEHVSWMRKIVEKLETRAMNKSSIIQKYELIGLCIFVAIPLPGTGAWTGALIAALLDMRLKRALPAIIIGVLIAALIISIVSYGVIKVF